jgi:hypothetical protein
MGNSEQTLNTWFHFDGGNEYTRCVKTQIRAGQVGKFEEENMINSLLKLSGQSFSGKELEDKGYKIDPDYHTKGLSADDYDYAYSYRVEARTIFKCSTQTNSFRK